MWVCGFVGVSDLWLCTSVKGSGCESGCVWVNEYSCVIVRKDGQKRNEQHKTVANVAFFWFKTEQGFYFWRVA